MNYSNFPYEFGSIPKRVIYQFNSYLVLDDEPEVEPEIETVAEIEPVPEIEDRSSVASSLSNKSEPVIVNAVVELAPEPEIDDKPAHEPEIEKEPEIENEPEPPVVVETTTTIETTTTTFNIPKVQEKLVKEVPEVESVKELPVEKVVMSDTISNDEAEEKPVMSDVIKNDDVIMSDVIANEVIMSDVIENEVVMSDVTIESDSENVENETRAAVIEKATANGNKKIDD